MKASILNASDIKEAFNSLDITVTKLSEDTGISRSWVSQSVNGKIFNRKVADRVMYYLEKDIATKKRIEEIKKESA